MTPLDGRIAIVTGGASGIGRGAAMAMARRGVHVVIADIHEAAASAVAAEIGAEGGRALAIRCDVSETDAFERLRDTVAAEIAPADIVMNNAGILMSGRPEDIPLDAWDRLMNINLMSVVRSVHAFIPAMTARGSGHIVNTASFAGLYPYAWDRLPYVTAKAAIVALSESLALYLKPKGVGMTCLCPGPVRTGIASGMLRYGSEVGTRGPGGQFPLLEPETVGEMVADAIEAERFFLPTDDQVRPILIERARDPDAFLASQMARWADPDAA